MNDKLDGISHIISATRYALQGLARAWSEQQAFRHEAAVLGILFVVMLVTEQNLADVLLVLGGWLFVMSIELLNSAVENAFNLISREQDDRIKAGKDMASAAIFLAIAANVGLWIFIFFG